MIPPRSARKVLSAAAGLMSGVTLLVLLLVIPLPAVLIPFALASWVGTPSLFAFLILLGLSVVIGSVAALLPAIALARFVLRVWPIDASGVVRRRCLVWQRRIAWASAAVVPLLAASILLQRVLGEGYFRAGAPPEEGIFGFILVTGWAAWGVMVAAGLGRSSWVHAHPTYFLGGKFLLYLRRFSSFADRTVVSEVLRAAPEGVPVVFIASPRGQARNWDPFVWAFSGLRLRHPLVSLPVQLRTSDEAWEQAIGRLISEASAVVLDLTESSASLEKERRLVTQGGHPERAIWLVDRGSRPSGDVAETTGVQIERGQLVAYRRRWAPLGLAVKIGLFVFVGYWFWFFSVGIIWAKNEVNATSVVAAVVLIGVWLVAGAVLVSRPSIDREARQSLQRLALAVMLGAAGDARCGSAPGDIDGA